MCVFKRPRTNRCLVSRHISSIAERGQAKGKTPLTDIDAQWHNEPRKEAVMTKQDLGKSSTGMQANIAGLLCYLLGIITGIIFYVIEKENKFVRFHAMQSIIVSGALIVLNGILMFIPVIGWVLMPLVGLAGFILWILLMIKAYQGEYFKLPIAGDIAEKNS